MMGTVAVLMNFTFYMYSFISSCIRMYSISPSNFSGFIWNSSLSEVTAMSISDSCRHNSVLNEPKTSSTMCRGVVNFSLSLLMSYIK